MSLFSGVLGDVKTHYNIGDDQAGALQTIFVSSYMIVAPIFGYLGDRCVRFPTKKQWQ